MRRDGTKTRELLPAPAAPVISSSVSSSCSPVSSSGTGKLMVEVGTYIPPVGTFQTTVRGTSTLTRIKAPTYIYIENKMPAPEWSLRALSR